MKNIDNYKKKKRCFLFGIIIFLISFIIICNITWKNIDFSNSEGNNIPNVVDPPQKEEDKDENIDKPELNGEEDKEDQSVDKEIIIDTNTTNNQTNTIIKNDKDNTSSGNNNINDNNSNDNENKEDNENDNEFIVDWMKSEKLNIFANSYFNGQNKIAPGVSGSYRFKVVNNRSSKVIYNVSFNEVNLYNINMKYRLKIGNDYVVGDENNWVSAEDLNYNSRIIDTKISELYTLEWRWFDSDNDNEVGQTINAVYSLSISVYGEDITD